MNDKSSLLNSARNYGHIASISLFALGAMLLSLSATALDINLLWTANPDMIMEGPPIVVDLDGDGDAEILTAAYENIIVVDGSGKELWRFDTRGRYSTCPAILERKGDSPLIYAGDNKGLFTCLDGEGHVVWQKDMENIFCAVPALADLNGDGSIELIQGSQTGQLSVLDALSGEIVWQRPLGGACSSPAIGDLDGDGKLETIVATSEGKVLAFDASGKVIWEFSMGETAPFWAIASPVLFANATGQLTVAIASHAGQFFCLDATGKVLWERSLRGGVASTISVADFDADGRADLFAVTELGILYRFDEEGRLLWDIDTQGRSLASGAIIDLDGDNTLEYLLCTQRGNLLAFSNAGDIVFNYQFPNRTINMTAAFGDIVKERPGLEFAVTGGESGQIFCFGTNAPVDSRAPWQSYRGNNRLTGAWLGLERSNTIRMTPENLNWDALFVGDDITFRVLNPMAGKEVLRAEATCVRPDASRQVAVGKVVGHQGLLKLPVGITAPGAYRFTWALKDTSNSTLLTGSQELTLQPYQNDQALARRAVLSLRGATVTEAEKGLAISMHQESLGIAEEADALSVLQVAVPGSGLNFRNDLDARTAALNTRSKRALRLAALSSEVSADCQIVAFAGTTWENRNVDKQLPMNGADPLHITRRCIPGEHESISVKLLNVTPDTVTVRVRIAAESGGPSISVGEVKSVPTNQHTVAWDPIVALGEGEISIPPLETREVWLDVDLSNVSPGTHEAEVYFDTGTYQTSVPISLEVFPFTMADFGAMRLCAWASYKADAVEDLLAHGNNVFTAALPPASIAKGDTPSITIDYTALDAFVAPLQGHDVFLLMGGIPALGVPMESEAYVPRLADFLEQVMTHLAAKGIDEEHIALYPHDEPGGAGWDIVNHYVTFGRQGLKARPGLNFYVNGGGDLAMFEALDEVASIWCPSFYMLSENTPEMNFLRASGKTIWSYDCSYAYARPIGANVKNINVTATYRMAAIFGFNFGATGIGYWCYNVGPTMWDPIELEYPLVYKNPDETNTPSRRWEAVREGMEDTRILIALREKLSDGTVGTQAKKKIRHLLDETLPEIATQSLGEVHLGAARYVLDDSNNDQTVDRLRNEMMDCVALLAEQ